MKTIYLYIAVFALLLVNAVGQAKVLTTDPLTGLPLSPATDPGNHTPGLSMTYNEPTKMPEAQICKSKYQGNFYSLYKIKVDAAVTWYSSHLPGFKKIQGYESGRAQIAFYKPDGTILVIITGDRGKEGEDVDAYAAAYERFEPGLGEKAITGLTTGKIDCR